MDSFLCAVVSIFFVWNLDIIVTAEPANGNGRRTRSLTTTEPNLNEAITQQTSTTDAMGDTNSSICKDFHWVRRLCDSGPPRDANDIYKCATNDGKIANACRSMDESPEQNLCRLKFIDVFCNTSIEGNFTSLENVQTPCEKNETKPLALAKVCKWLPNICRKVSVYLESGNESEQCVSKMGIFCYKWNRVCVPDQDINITTNNTACPDQGRYTGTNSTSRTDNGGCQLLLHVVFGTGIGVALTLIVGLISFVCWRLVCGQSDGAKDVSSGQTIESKSVSAATYMYGIESSKDNIILGTAAAELPSSSTDIKDTRSDVYIGQCSASTYRTLERIKTKKKKESNEDESNDRGGYEQILTDVIDGNNPRAQNFKSVDYAKLGARQSAEHTYAECGINNENKSSPCVEYFILSKQESDSSKENSNSGNGLVVSDSGFVSNSDSALNDSSAVNAMGKNSTELSDPKSFQKPSPVCSAVDISETQSVSETNKSI